MSTKTKLKTFSVSYKMTGDFSIDFKAASLEEAVAQGRALGLGKALEKLGSGAWNDFDGDVSAIWEHS